ncbi:MAG: DUF177 domain-containing protein [Gammaproteobacteria bacterium]|nr:DUF177 domain-containing protein [Gammaproteobacteria bacterium]MBQ0840127.1 DUF177 domain-containing protein [Gammaproteobacteria bacterium]
MSIASKTSVIPHRVDALKACTQGATYEGIIMPQDLPRLSATVVSVKGEVAAKVHFSRDESNYRVVTGELDVLVSVQCQRCLSALDYDLHAQMDLAIVTTEVQLENLPKECEGWLLDEQGEADLYEAIEEELLLALPIVAYHDPADCSAQGQYSTGDFEEPVPEKKNPFAVLGSLKLSDKAGSTDKES